MSTLQHSVLDFVHRFWKSNARSVTVLAFGFLIGTAVRRMGWKWTTLLCAICCTLIFERNRRVDRQRLIQQRALRMARLQQMWTHDSMLMLLRDPQGMVSTIRPSHLALMLREGDFNAEDYEELLRLDSEIGPVKPQSASEDSISKLPIKSVDCNMNDNCAICLEQFQKGELAKTMSCQRHTFHAPCLDQWLQVKGSCPLCLTHCS